MPVLVAYASRHSSTQGIAKRIAAILRAGSRWTLRWPKTRAIRRAMTLSSLAAPCMPPGGWPRRRSSSGTTVRSWPAARCGCSASARSGGGYRFRRRCPSVLAALGDSVGARDHHVFRGAIDASKLRGVERLIRLFLPQGDFRDWPDIEAWATGIASELHHGTRPDVSGRDRSGPLLEGL